MKKSFKAIPTSVVIVDLNFDNQQRAAFMHALCTEIVGKEVPKVRRQGSAIVCRFTSKAAAAAGYASISEHLQSLGYAANEHLRYSN